MLQTFLGNERHRSTLEPLKITKIFELLLEFKADAAFFFDVLQEIVENTTTGDIYQRNCQVVSKYLTDNLNSVAHVLQYTERER